MFDRVLNTPLTYDIKLHKSDWTVHLCGVAHQVSLSRHCCVNESQISGPIPCCLHQQYHNFSFKNWRQLLKGFYNIVQGIGNWC